MRLEKEHFYTFGPFRLEPEERTLLRDGRLVPVAPKAFEALLILVENAGHLVDKDDLMEQLWPRTFVEEGNLTKHVSLLRKALGEAPNGREFIETIPKRGYRFVAEVTELTKETSREPVPSRTAAGLTPDEVPPVARQMSAVRSLESERAELPPASGSPPARHLEVVQATPVGAGVIEMPSRAGAEALHHGQDARATVRRWWALALVAVVVLAAAAVTYYYIQSRSFPKLTDKDTVVLADFTNTTGDSVFDGTLRQGLSAQLEQSPFLNLLPDTRVAQTLALMGQRKDVRLTRQLGREVCQRTASAATIEGSIAGHGSQYVVGLEAINCRNGELLASQRETANGREQVLVALGKAATKMRRKLGESLASVEKYDVSPNDATTPSLEALQAYNLGLQAEDIRADWAAAIPLLQRAVTLDPNFAMAWSVLAVAYGNLDEETRRAEAMRKAYELRDRLSRPEELAVESAYQLWVTGDFEAARRINESNAQEYPRSWVPLDDLVAIYVALGEHDKALAAVRRAVELEPKSGVLYANLATCYLNLGRLDEVKATIEEAQAHKLDSPLLHMSLYLVDFLQHDMAGMEQEAAGLAGKPGYEELLFYYESDTASYAGRFAEARQLSRRAADSAMKSGDKEAAAEYRVEAAAREALVGNRSLAEEQALAALALSNGKEVEAMSAIALGLAGDSAQTMHFATDLNKRFPKDTVVQAESLPMLYAAAALGKSAGPADARLAIQALSATPYELGMLPVRVNFCPYTVFLRAQAYLAAGHGPEAAAEFQKVLDHPGLVVNQPIGALAHLGLGRAYAVEAGLSRQETGSASHNENGGVRSPLPSDALAKARIAYQDFLAVWKDADPDIPILRQAKAEYARLQ